MANKAILLFGSNFPGGAERRFARAFVYLAQYHSDLMLIVNSNLYEALIRHRIPLDRAKNVLVVAPLWGEKWIRRLKLLAIFWTFHIRNILRCHRVVHIHFVTAPSLLTLFIAISLPSISVTQSIYNKSVIDPSTPSNWLTNLIFYNVVESAQNLDFLSEDILYNFQSRFETRLFSARLLVSPCSFSDYTVFRPAAKKEYSFCSVSRLIPGKGLFLFLDAIAVFLKMGHFYHQANFLILGNGPLESQLWAHAGRLGIIPYITIKYTPAPEDFLSRSHIFLSLQEVENYPSQSLLEAMACENAIIATDVGKTAALVTPETGIRVPSDPAAVASAMQRLYDDDALRGWMGKNARALVMREHTVERFSKYLYETVLHARCRKDY